MNGLLLQCVQVRSISNKRSFRHAFFTPRTRYEVPPAKLLIWFGRHSKMRCGSWINNVCVVAIPQILGLGSVIHLPRFIQFLYC